MARKKKEDPKVQLAAVLDLTAAAPLADALLARRKKATVVDASNVQRLGAQCLQVLIAAANTWKEDGVAFRIDGMSDGFSEGLRLMGVTPEMFSAEGFTQ
jgi:chemotaxis protein CheX